MVKKEHSVSLRGSALVIGLVLIGLYFTNIYSLLLFDVLAELLTVVMAFTIFSVAWNSRRFLNSSYLAIMGIAFLFIGGLNIIDTLDTIRVNLIKGYESKEMSIEKIATWYIMGISLLFAPLFLKRKLRVSFVISAFATIMFVILASVLYWNITPESLANETGLTPLGIVNEYAIVLIFLTAAFQMVKYRREFDRNIVILIIASIAVAIASRMVFAINKLDEFSLLFLVGHFLMILSFYITYVAFVNMGLIRPYEELEHSREQLGNLSRHLEQVREEERKVIARELHDELGQTLTALKMDISLLSQGVSKSDNSQNKAIERMSGLVETAIYAEQNISAKLRPGLLIDLGLNTAIQWQAAEFRKRTGIQCEVTMDDEDFDVRGTSAMAIFNILQEALTNVARHSQATKVEIYIKKDSGKLILTVRDNGKGITPDQISGFGSFGIIGMKERAQSCGGNLEISGAHGKGTSVLLSIPVI